MKRCEKARLASLDCVEQNMLDKEAKCGDLFTVYRQCKKEMLAAARNEKRRMQ